VVGREHELAAIEELLATGEPELRALVLEGEPGIGKSTLWQAAVDAAPAEARVLSCRPVEAETKLSYASVADLLEPIVDEGLPELPEPQRNAVEVALLRASPGARAPERRAVATGVHSLLSRAASLAPLVVAIDDVQWLDVASAAVLAFALRRLAASSVRVVLAARVTAEVVTDPLELEHNLPGRVRRLRLGPLSLSGLHHVIRDQLGQVLPRPVLQRVAEASGGNPLFAVELARALAETGARPGPGEPLPVPDTLGALMRTRLDRLSGTAREALLASACLSVPTVELVGAAGLDEAERSGVITIDDGRVRFTHPLLASTVYSEASSEQRHAMHRRLAAAVTAPEEQARHLALGVEDADESVAARLAAAARDANVRAAPQAAVELAELALRLTPPGSGDVTAQRELELAEHVFRAGDTGEARRLLERFAAEQPPGNRRARALELLARVNYVTGTAAEAVACCERALEDVEDDDLLRARIHATFARVSYDDFGRGRGHARAALELLDALPDPDPAVLVHALCAEIGAAAVVGDGLDMAVVERALEVEQLAPMPDVADRVSASMGTWLKQLGDFEGARRWLELTYRAAIEEGDDASLPYALSHLPQLELWTGNWAAAERRALEHLEAAEEMAQDDQRRQALFNLGFVHAHMGRVDEARAESDELLREAERIGDDWSVANALAVLGFVELSVGNAAAAAPILERCLAIRDALGATEPLRAQGDFAEALIELGELERATAVVESYESRARLTDRAPLLALALAARALLSAARQDLDAASAALDEALAQHARAPVGFERARTLLVLGQVQRRRGERRAARETLEEARRVFAELGAPPWAERAEVELRRIPIRRGAADELTPTEEQVALLAASGRTNREMAQALFMSPKTIEANLTRIYRKLGISSRAELGATMAARATPKP
jgi:DNA-binding CsgD family transcriptional regulator